MKPKNRLPKQPLDLRPQQIMCKRLAEAMRAAAIEMKLQVSGQAAIEGNGSKLIVIYSAYPNGDIMVWFLDKGFYNLMVLVNQKFKHVATFPVTHAADFQKELTRIKDELEK